MTTLRVLISGAGVAGPALATALSGSDAEVTVVETAPRLRTSGFAVDFRGPTHFGVLERLGILDELRERQTHGSAMCAVDENGRELFRLPAEFTGGELEVLRSDLSAALVRRSAPTTEYVFGDRITALTDTPDGVRVAFARGADRTVDVVVGADGMHSGVRRLRFGPEERYVRHLEYYIAGWDMPDPLGLHRESLQYGVPGRMAALGSGPVPGRATAMAVFASPRVDVDYLDAGQQKALIRQAYAGGGWHVPEMLAGLDDASELYFDAISRVEAPTWTDDRVALLGDAAWGVTLGGMGVGTGLVGAYVLAGELRSADPATALRTYEQHLRGYAGRWQKHANPGRFLAPGTRHGLWLRNTLLGNGVVQKMLLRSTDSFASDPALPTYA